MVTNTVREVCTGITACHCYINLECVLENISYGHHTLCERDIYATPLLHYNFSEMQSFLSSLLRGKRAYMYPTDRKPCTCHYFYGCQQQMNISYKWLSRLCFLFQKQLAQSPGNEGKSLVVSSGIPHHCLP